VGDKEVENNTVAVRTRSGNDLGSMTLSQFTEGLTAEIVSRGRSTLDD
jgi:threonyl-tRNA synthetase